MHISDKFWARNYSKWGQTHVTKVWQREDLKKEQNRVNKMWNRIKYKRNYIKWNDIYVIENRQASLVTCFGRLQSISPSIQATQCSTKLYLVYISDTNTVLSRAFHYLSHYDRYSCFTACVQISSINCYINNINCP